MRYEKLIKPLAFASLVHCSEITCSQVGLSRLCSATFEQLFAVLATSSKFCLSEQFLSKILV